MGNEDSIEKSALEGIDRFKAIRFHVRSTVQVDLDWYRKASSLAAFFHRALGLLLIALSASLPLVVSLQFNGRDFVVAVIGVLIACLSGLNAFFRFGDLWRTNMQGMVELKNDVAVWKLRMLEAEFSENLQMAVTATDKLFKSLQQIDNENAADYVSTINFPTKQ